MRNAEKEVYLYNGILLSLQKEWNTVTCYNVGESWRRYSQWKKADPKNHIFYDCIYMKYSEQANL